MKAKPSIRQPMLSMLPGKSKGRGGRYCFVLVLRTLRLGLLTLLPDLVTIMPIKAQTMLLLLNKYCNKYNIFNNINIAG